MDVVISVLANAVGTWADVNGGDRAAASQVAADIDASLVPADVGVAYGHGVKIRMS